MAKPKLEFHRPAGPWVAAAGPVGGIWTQTLAEDPDTGAYTGLVRYDSGVDTSPLGVRVHDYWEEVYLLEGDLTDLRLGETFSAEMYACRGWSTGRGGQRAVC